MINFFYPYQLPPTPYLRHFSYWRVMELTFLLIVIFFKEAGKLFTWVSSNCRAFNALDRWCVLIGFASDEGVASSSAPFYSIYKWHLLLIFSISSLLIFERERSSPLTLSTHPLLPLAYPSLSLKPFLL